ncbi:hypothetical protein Scep_008778 [Stephania cephalantha]|uniref:Uncharacterized protein n=1 Tax=Stephania cephalantha TaxID=152367 RepID=A0AAP0JUB1_9MAGN
MSSLDYWLRWQVPVCGLIIVAPPIIAAIFISRIKRAPIIASDQWTPCWRGLNPLWLLIYRASAFAFMAWMLSRVAAHNGPWAFFFYTQWTFTLVTIYFMLASIISAHGCWKYSSRRTPPALDEERDGFLKKKKKKKKKQVDEAEARTTLTSVPNNVGLDNEQEDTVEAGFWGYLMQIIYQTSAGASMLTDVVFWGLLFPFQSKDHFRLNPLMAGMHSLNAVFLILDATLNRLAFPWFRMAYFIFWSAIYIVFQWISHASGVSWWPYQFLELSTPWAPAWYLAIALIHIPCYAFFVLVVKIKTLIFSIFFPGSFMGPC